MPPAVIAEVSFHNFCVGLYTGMKKAIGENTYGLEEQEKGRWFLYINALCTCQYLIFGLHTVSPASENIDFYWIFQCFLTGRQGKSIFFFINTDYLNVFSKNLIMHLITFWLMDNQ